MKNYIEYNTKKGITELLQEIELEEATEWVVGMHKGEMIASIKIPDNNFNFNEKGELIDEYSSQKYLRIDYLVSLRPVSFDFKIVGYRFI